MELHTSSKDKSELIFAWVLSIRDEWLGKQEATALPQGTQTYAAGVGGTVGSAADHARVLGKNRKTDGPESGSAVGGGVTGSCFQAAAALRPGAILIRDSAVAWIS